MSLPSGSGRRNGAASTSPDQRIVLTYDPEATLADRVRAALPGLALEIVSALNVDDLPDALPGATILFGNHLPRSLLPHVGDLRWIQSVGAGVDGLLSAELAATDIVVTNTSGAFAVQMAEHALCLMFAMARRLPGAMRSQAARAYEPEPRDELFELTGKTLGIVGFGDVGQALARRARGIGMRIIALRRHPHGATRTQMTIPPLPFDPLAKADYPQTLADEIMGPDRLRDLLRDADIVVNVAPLTPATALLFGPKQFAQMRPAACFINLGRGESVDQDALIEALRDGVIAAAGLDVTTPEPLPADSPLWILPNVILTAHYAGWSDAMLERIYTIFLDNLVRFDRGVPLRNVVDVRAGY